MMSYGVLDVKAFSRFSDSVCFARKDADHHLIKKLRGFLASNFEKKRKKPPTKVKWLYEKT